MDIAQMKKSHIFALIAAFVVITLGSFIWFIATWDPALRAPVGG
jgi:hypothetical protein